ncbi:MAG: glycosyltransferase family 25 protein [Ahrensia sp.]|nr:glycosyltransferase family 25 protein [Ahrensia sp.]
MQQKASALGIDVQRVEAIDGRTIPEAEWHDFDIKKFRARCGRHPAAGEYGCYMSHIKALRTFIDSGAQSAIILEDDAELEGQLLTVAAALDHAASDQALLVRLCTHRQDFFEKLQELSTGHQLGQCWHGPTGSASAYWINRVSAQRLLDFALPGSLPYDILLERAWGHGVRALVIGPSLLKQPRPPTSTINQSFTLKHQKFKWYNRWRTYLFRTQEFFLRIAHCAANRQKIRFD